MKENILSLLTVVSNNSKLEIGFLLSKFTFYKKQHRMTQPL